MDHKSSNRVCQISDWALASNLRLNNECDSDNEAMRTIEDASFSQIIMSDQ